MLKLLLANINFNQPYEKKSDRTFTFCHLAYLCENNFLIHNLPRTRPYVVEPSCPF